MLDHGSGDAILGFLINIPEWRNSFLVILMGSLFRQNLFGERIQDNITCG